jgi:Flp pilus assembly protein TadG
MDRTCTPPQTEDGAPAVLAPTSGKPIADDRGAASVEFALIVIPLLVIVFGIISYGYLLTFRQAISMAAAEGVRAAAVTPAGLPDADRIDRALTAVNDSLGYGVTCANVTGTRVDGMACTVTIVPGCGLNDCAEITLDYAYGSRPLLPQLPFVPLPSNLVYATSAAVS